MPSTINLRVLVFELIDGTSFQLRGVMRFCANFFDQFSTEKEEDFEFFGTASEMCENQKSSR